MIAGTTGHRPDKLGGWRSNNPVQRKVRVALFDALTALRPDLVLTGMALGVDQWMAEACLVAGIPFKAIVPFRGQETPWVPHAQVHYRKLLEKAIEVVVVCEGEYKPWKLHKRNEWVVDHCDVLVAVWDGSPGGTGNCVEYAQSVGRPIHQVAWRDYVIN